MTNRLSMTTPPMLTVIVPAFRCADMLGRCLEALTNSTLERAHWELIVVDDNSGDATPQIANGIADCILTTPAGPRGPGFARNLGAAHATGETLVFIDSDVLVTRTALAQFASAFASDATVTAIHGAYDDQPGDRGMISQYRNLLHHWVHTMNGGLSTTFWAGCGAVRRQAFLAIGGFNAERFPRPQIEDIELGYRLTDAGHRILLDPAIQGKHLKRWTLKGVLRTDLFDRAIPWMHLMIDQKAVAHDGPLNLRSSEKYMTAAFGLAMLALVMFIAVPHVAWLWLSAGSVLFVLIGNLSLFSWFAHARGVGFALAVVPLRLMYYGTCVAGAGWAMATHRWLPRTAQPQQMKTVHDVHGFHEHQTKGRS